MNKRQFLHVAAAATFFSVTVPTALLTVGCDHHRDQISKVLADPNSFGDKDVQIAGRVTRVLDPSSGLLSLSAYQVDDGSGRIWVISHSGAPRVGDEVGVKARVRQDLHLSGDIVGAVLNEEERKGR